MADLALNFYYKLGPSGTLTDVTSPVLSDPGGTYGAKRTDTNEVLIPAGTAMDHIGTGHYTATLTDAPIGVTIQYVVKYVRPDGTTGYSNPPLTARLSEEVAGSSEGTITLTVPDEDEPSSIELTRLIRLDTSTDVTLPSPATFTYDADTDKWTLHFDEPDAALKYIAVILFTWSDSTTTESLAVINGSTATVQGTYWTWDGIKNILGTLNAEIASQLDNGTTAADMQRVIADGTIADAYTNRRARLDGQTIPLTDDSFEDFSLVVYVTNLYASFLLVAHREWFAELTDDARSKAILSLEGRAMSLYAELFPGGADGSDDGDTHPPGTFEDVPLTFNNDGGVVDEFSEV